MHPEVSRSVGVLSPHDEGMYRTAFSDTADSLSTHREITKANCQLQSVCLWDKHFLCLTYQSKDEDREQWSFCLLQKLLLVVVVIQLKYESLSEKF